MKLVHEQKDRPGRWEVAWTWLPYFLASDRALHKYVDQKMTEEFRGTVVQEEADRQRLLEQMHHKVIELILEKHPIPGLRKFLSGYTYLEPGATRSTPGEGS